MDQKYDFDGLHSLYNSFRASDILSACESQRRSGSRLVDPVEVDRGRPVVILN